jgi:Ca2+-binding EF-hand superfamily protein
VRRALSNWNMPMAPHEIDAIFATADVDSNGTIDWQEFAEAFREALQESPFRQGDVWKGG